MLDMDIPVLVMGAGPSGATTALLLAREGVRLLVISRHRSTANTPRAHIFNQRAMEVLRDAGIEKQCNGVASTVERESYLFLPPICFCFCFSNQANLTFFLCLFSAPEC
jgi:2-polyprenyl-6-methoxyphenol hydroxylase-like FAD-dependent oxidoreductase